MGLLSFARDFSAESAEFAEELCRLFFIRRLAVPAEIALDLAHPFAGYGVCNDNGRLFKDGFRLFARSDELRNVVTVLLKHMPAKRAIFIGKWFKRHHVFRVSVDLDIITINNTGQIA